MYLRMRFWPRSDDPADPAEVVVHLTCWVLGVGSRHREYRVAEWDAVAAFAAKQDVYRHVERLAEQVVKADVERWRQYAVEPGHGGRDVERVCALDAEVGLLFQLVEVREVSAGVNV